MGRLGQACPQVSQLASSRAAARAIDAASAGGSVSFAAPDCAVNFACHFETVFKQSSWVSSRSQSPNNNSIACGTQFPQQLATHLSVATYVGETWPNCVWRQVAGRFVAFRRSLNRGERVADKSKTRHYGPALATDPELHMNKAAIAASVPRARLSVPPTGECGRAAGQEIGELSSRRFLPGHSLEVGRAAPEQRRSGLKVLIHQARNRRLQAALGALASVVPNLLHLSRPQATSATNRRGWAH